MQDLVRILHGAHYTDMGPFRAIRRSSLERLNMSEMTYGWNLEMQVKAARQSLRIREIAVDYKCRTGGVSKVSGNLKRISEDRNTNPGGFAPFTLVRFAQVRTTLSFAATYFEENTLAPHRKRALVTGGAGLIGSHIVDLLVREGWTVRILDNLSRRHTRIGRPEWINSAAEFRLGNVQDYETMRSALTDIDVVFHEAAYGGYMPEMAKYVLVNSFGTAQMLEIIRDHRLPIQKVLVASSQAVYSEGAANCPQHGHVAPALRPMEQLRAGDFSSALPHLRQANYIDSNSGGYARRR